MDSVTPNRLDTVVRSIVEGIRGALREHDVSFQEYRAGMKYLMETAKGGELPLLIDLFMNTTIVENMNQGREGSTNDLEGPYFREDVPVVTDGKIKTMEQFGGQPMLLRGIVKDTAGNPVPEATIFVWSSTPDGKYSGFHDDIPIEYYRGQLVTGPNGEYQVESTVPVPYQIPNKGKVGALLEQMGQHSWRPAHVHYKIRKAGFLDMTTQAYFEGGDWVGDDCCQGKHTDEFVMPEVIEDGKRVLEIDFTLDAA
ncbi:MAG: dioxygenase [Pseudomonadota bacterium]